MKTLDKLKKYVIIHIQSFVGVQTNKPHTNEQNP